MALTATASTSLHLDDVRVPMEHVISTDLQGFVRRIRPAFLLLQTAFCSGVSVAALEGARAAHGILAAQFSTELDDITRRSHALRERLYICGGAFGSGYRGSAAIAARRRRAGRCGVTA